MFQPHEAAHVAPKAASEGFNAGETIISHVANSSLDHPLIHLPKVLGIDFSVTKHVFMVWLVAALLFLIVTCDRPPLHPPRAGTPGAERRHERPRSPGRVHPRLHRAAQRRQRSGCGRGRRCCSRSSCSSSPANLIGLIPAFDVLALLNHTVLHLPEDSFLTQVTHGGTTATGNFNVTAALATVTFLDHHHRRRPRPWLRQALEEHGADRAALADLLLAHPDRDHGHVRPAVRADDAAWRPT